MEKLRNRGQPIPYLSSWLTIVTLKNSALYNTEVASPPPGPGEQTSICFFYYSVHKLGCNFANCYTCICSYIDSPMISWDRSDGIAEHRHNIWVDTLYKASSCPILTPTQQLKQNKKEKATLCMIWHANTGPDILFLKYGTKTFPSSPATNEHLGDKCSRTGNICKNKQPVAKHI